MAKAPSSQFTLPPLSSSGMVPLREFWMQALIVVALGFGLYFNSLDNKYALDDDIVIQQNRYVMNGFSGIGDILSKDAYASFYESMGVKQQLAGGRYRPLSIVTFAIENGLFAKEFVPKPPPSGLTPDQLDQYNLQQEKVERVLFEKKENLNMAHIRHGFQVFYFLLSMVLLLYLLRTYIFRSNTDIAFFAVLLFTAHPIHTEVVANVKSRDEIFSLLFITLTMIFFFRWDVSRKIQDLLWCGLAFFLALLSKEYAVVVPALMVAGLVLFNKRKFSNAIVRMAPVLLVLLLYAGVRYQAIGEATAPVNLEKQDILNDPYLNLKRVNGVVKEKGSIAASKIDMLDNYVYLLLYPKNLSADYSYHHFPYSTFGDGRVWLSLLVTLGLLALTIWLWVKKHELAFAMIFYFAFFALICNIVFDIGATMGERLIYHSSLGFAMVVAWLFVKGGEWLEEKNAPGKVIAGVALLGIVGAYGYRTVERNPDWESDFTLFTHDVKYVHESALANGNAGARYMDKGLEYKNDPMRHSTLVKYADSAIVYLQKAVTIHPKYVNGYLNLGLAYYYKGEYEKAANSWNNANEYFNHHQLLQAYSTEFFSNPGMAYGQKKQYDSAAIYFRWAAMTDPSNQSLWSNYGGSSFMAGHFEEAKKAFDEAYKLDNSNQDVKNGFASADMFEKVQQKVAANLNDYATWLEAANAYANQPAFWGMADNAYRKALELSPGNAAVQKAMADFETKKAEAKKKEEQQAAAPGK